MLAEFARAYGGPPSPELPWPTFVALLKRVPRFDAREKLRIIDGTSVGAARALAGKSPALDAQLRDLEEAAYAGRRRGQPLVVGATR